MAEAQPYQALYRRYRPQRFSEVRGQEHVTRALRNAVRDGKVAHAYLFSGPRGTGKTSTARILAMALNCESPVEGEPDGTCTSCVAVRQGASMDVFELDAASNRKLEETRDLLSRVALGTPGRWKVYIIDEVHQLTTDSASALLKTLEEPPGHVVFVLATTDPQKVLPTIQSRTQHFQFHLLDGDLLGQLLSDINEDAALGLSDQALRVAVERGRGSARDAESALEQLAAVGGEVDESSPVAGIVEALAQRQPGKVLEAVATAVNAGREPRRLGTEVVSYLRDCFLSLQAPRLVLAPGTERQRLGELATQMGLAPTVRAMEVLGQSLIDMRDAVDPRVTLEVALVRLASPALDTSLGALVDRVERLEAALRARVDTSPSPGTAAGGAAPSFAAGAATPAPGTPRTGPPAKPSAGAQPATSGPPAVVPPTPPSPAGSAPSGPAQARVALGAILRAGAPPAAGPATPASPVPAPPVPVPSRAGRSAPTPGTGASVPPVERPAEIEHTSPAAQAPRPPTPPMPDATTVASAPDAAGTTSQPMPTRDEITLAWGDKILDMLDQRTRAYVQTGRFSEVSGGYAVFALPNAVMVEKAKQFNAQIQAALADHFGRPVPLRFVIDAGPSALVDVAAEPAPDEPEYDLSSIDELTDAGSVPPVTAEQRLLEAFPGSVVED
ncbi:MAG TPA: DNA polymerase III subunit gamma/tau [Acidimicrobiales bacterium]|nr:DNA polymerase III subunit gamma/tau [Acidimicrobiales bacterium]